LQIINTLELREQLSDPQQVILPVFVHILPFKSIDFDDILGRVLRRVIEDGPQSDVFLGLPSILVGRGGPLVVIRSEIGALHLYVGVEGRIPLNHLDLLEH
jgi:hypothetical protein